MKTNNAFSNFVFYERKNINKISKMELAKRCNTSYSTISLIENGEKRPTIDLLRAIQVSLRSDENYIEKLYDSSFFKSDFIFLKKKLKSLSDKNKKMIYDLVISME